MEKTYLEMLSELHEAIEADYIPINDKEEILETLASLYDMLWTYSA